MAYMTLVAKIVNDGKVLAESKVIIMRPSWDDVYNGYPLKNKGDPDLGAFKNGHSWKNRGASDVEDIGARTVFQNILGRGYDAEKKVFNGVSFENACATRVSFALVKSMVDVRKDFLIQDGEFKGKGFIASAKGLKEWLSEPDVWGNADLVIEGKTTLEKVAKKINGRNCVYIILGGENGKKDHATLWIGDNNDAIGGKNYIENGGTVYFWELMATTVAVDVKAVANYIVKEMLNNIKSDICNKLQKLNYDFWWGSPLDVIGNKKKAYTLWVKIVGKNRVWDHKNYILKNFGEWAYYKLGKNSLKFSSDLWSNIHYGFVGKCAGFLDIELLNGAGWAQIGDNNKSLKSWDTWKEYFRNRMVNIGDADVLGGFDDPSDQQAIKIGIDLYDKHKDNLTADLIIENLLELYYTDRPIRIEKCEKY